MNAAGRTAFALGALAALGTSCSASDASVTVQIPSAVLGQTEWVEVGFLPGGCPPTTTLVEGLPAGATTGRVAFHKDDPKRPAIGLIPTGRYGAAATARDAQCAVLAAGCAPIDLGSSRGVTIPLAPVSSPVGACSAGTVCSYGRCVPPTTPDDPSVGADCSLALMGAGPLGNPLAQETQVGSPAVVPTATGFLIAYREFEPLSGIGRLTLYPVDQGGAALPAHSETLAGRCPGADETDAVGLAVAGDKGLTVLARSPCQGKSGYDLFSVSTAADVTFYSVDNAANGATLALSPAKSVAPLPSGAWLVGLRVDGTSLLQTTDGKLAAKANDKIGAAGDTGIWVTTTSSLVAVLAAGKSKIAIPDGGAPEAGANDPVLRLTVAPTSTPLASLPAAIELPGAWGSVAALGNRVVVVGDGSSSGKPVAYTAFDLVGTVAQKKVEDGFSTESLQGKPISADVALVKDMMFVAVEQSGAISLVAFEHATTVPVLKRTLSLGDDPRLPSVKNVRDGRIAVAASDTRVVVVWASGTTLAPNDPVGGYAVYACR
jgi:hypothetical protein